MTNTITIETKHGPATVQVSDGSAWQFNCFLPPAGGAGVFAMFPVEFLKSDCIGAFRTLLEAGPHEENQNLGHITNAAMVAGSVNVAQINVTQAIKNGVAARQ